jgi:hypothetical protein
VSLDPTTIKDDSGEPVKPGRYTKWILRAWQDKTLPEEDFYKVTEYLTPLSRFRFVTKGLDVMKAKTLPDLYEMVHDLMSRKSQKEEVEAIKADGLVCLYNEVPWQVYRVDTWEASKLIGAGTQWCTASRNSDGNFRAYSSHGPLVVFIKDSSIKYQYNISCGIYNANDRRVDSADGNYEEMCQILGKLAKPLFGLGFKVSRISVKSSGYIRFIKDERKFETDGKPVFNGKYLIVKEVKSFSLKYNYCGYYNYDFGTYSLMRTNSGKSFPLGSRIRPKTIWEDKGAILLEEQKKPSIKFLLDQPGFGPRILETDLARYIKNLKHYYYSKIEVQGNTLDLNVGQASKYRVDLSTGLIISAFDIYRDRHYYYGNHPANEYLFDKDTGKFVSELPDHTPLYHDIDAYSESRISDYVCRNGSKIDRVRYNNSYSSIISHTPDRKIRLGSKTMFLDWPDTRQVDLIYIKNPAYNGLTREGPRKIIITPWGWAFWETKALRVTDPIWYTVDPSPYLGAICALHSIEVVKKGRTGKPLGHRRCTWFEHVLDEV